MLPAIFVSHGSPMLAIENAEARDFLKRLPEILPERPKAILMISAHWERLRPGVNAPPHHETIHDFGGFPPALYQLTYPAPPSADLARRVAELLTAGGLPTDIDQRRGLDHGAWVPLMVSWPDADIPVVQLSVQTRLGPGHHYKLGQLLAPLREEGILIIGSGSFTHDLASFRTSGGRIDAPEPDWVHSFAEWMAAALKDGRLEDLLNYRRLAPEAAHNHPTEEHLLPLYVALGAGPETVKHLHQSTTYGILRMDAFAFG
ncbi:MAG TPA: class III extradiol ring-cleavage dioxygenase [Hyphomonadaceae bacterium]|nr:class III extradiol ring-cleavage dioxygenase [Hyphomonadaceae bacterium]HPI49601.1 class III extradiol ring-cleavage dioxygenase [Hyphomonadaceae bacterium]